MLCTSSNIFFKKKIRKFSFSKCYSLLHFQKFPFTSRSTDNVLTVFADRIARVLKTFGTSQAAVFNISKTFHRVLHTAHLYKFRLYGV